VPPNWPRHTNPSPRLGTVRDDIGYHPVTSLGSRRPPRAAKSDPPSVLYRDSEPLTENLHIAGDIELRLTATSTATDTAWIVMLRDIAPDGIIADITGGSLRASLR
jgi:predicted acyl esterase